MSILIKSKQDIEGMRKAGKLAGKLLNYLEGFIKPGISTGELNELCEEFTKKHNAVSAPLGYHGFPKSMCTSINDVVCHGIPNEVQILQEGDIVNVDVTPKLNGYHGDTSRTFCVGKVDPEVQLLVDRTKEAMDRGIAMVKPGNHFGDIGTAIEDYIAPFGYSIVKMFGGHGIGKIFHEDPFVHHHKRGVKGPEFKPGMIFTIEPMINMGKENVFIDPDDKWTVFTDDGSLSAQFEHTVLVTENGVEILTLE